MTPCPAGEEKRIRVGIVDDHAITRIALWEFLSASPALEVVGEAATGRDALELARAVAMQVLLLDIEMPGQNGIDVLPRLLARENAPAVLILSGHDPAVFGPAMIGRGAAGYLSKQCDPAEIVTAITAVVRGHIYLNGATFPPSTAGGSMHTHGAPHSRFTGRELQVFLRLAYGQSRQDAACDLAMSPQTLSRHRRNVMEKVSARSNSELTYYAIKNNLMS